MVTLHPETLGDLEIKKIKKVFNIIKRFKNIFFIFTASNQDEKGDKINKLISKFVKKIIPLHLSDRLARQIFSIFTKL